MFFPKISLWSNDIGVITVKSGVRTFVESSLPPSPVSTTAISTFLLAKYLNAIAVVVSKKVDSISSISERCSSTNSTILESDIGLPFTRMRSLNRIKCGDVYNPTFKPASIKIEEIIALVDPFPLVPAICID